MTDEEKNKIDVALKEILNRSLLPNEMFLVEQWKKMYDFPFIMTCIDMAQIQIQNGKTLNAKYVDGIMYNQLNFYQTLKVYENNDIWKKQDNEETEQMDWLNK